MGRDESSTADERTKGIAVCENCQDIAPVWVRPDGTLVPISQQDVCSCKDLSLQTLGEEDLDMGDATRGD